MSHLAMNLMGNPLNRGWWTEIPNDVHQTVPVLSSYPLAWGCFPLTSVPYCGRCCLYRNLSLDIPHFFRTETNGSRGDFGFKNLRRRMSESTHEAPLSLLQLRATIAFTHLELDQYSCPPVLTMGDSFHLVGKFFFGGIPCENGHPKSFFG